MTNIILLIYFKTGGGVPEWPKGADCKSVSSAFGGSNPPPSTIEKTGTYESPYFFAFFF